MKKTIVSLLCVAVTVVALLSPNVAEAQATGSATITFTPPTQNVDGTPITDLKGYSIGYAQEPSVATSHSTYKYVDVTDPSATSFTVTGLSPGTWYFVMRAKTGAGNSDRSNIQSKTIASPTTSTSLPKPPTIASVK